MSEEAKIGKTIGQYKLIKFLGKGKFSTVFQAEDLKTQQLVALKIIKIFDMMDKKQVDKCLQEVKFLQDVNHPNIVKYLDSFMHENELLIVIEWADKGDLKRYIRKMIQEKDYLDELKVFDFTYQIASALKHMHEKRIIHRDLKPANILVFSDGVVKLGDLGLGRYLSIETIKAFSKVGTPLYMSPELIKNKGYDFKTDVWSLGCVCFELITLKSPFITDAKNSLFDLYSKIEKGDYPKLTDSRLSKELVELVDQMLTVNQEDRISLDDALQKLTYIFNSIEDKPKIDPFIVMEYILEKLHLINYESNYSKKFKKELFTKYSFSCNVFGKPNTPGVLTTEVTSNINYVSQFYSFYDLSQWLIQIVKNKTPLKQLNKVEVVFSSAKVKSEDLLKKLLTQLKQLDIKIIDNSKLINGFGEAACLILTQLLDKYLISLNFSFSKPIFNNKKKKPIDLPINLEKDDRPKNSSSASNNTVKTNNTLITTSTNEYTNNNNDYNQDIEDKKFDLRGIKVVSVDSKTISNDLANFDRVLDIEYENQIKAKLSPLEDVDFNLFFEISESIQNQLTSINKFDIRTIANNELDHIKELNNIKNVKINEIKNYETVITTKKTLNEELDQNINNLNLKFNFPKENDTKFRMKNSIDKINKEIVNLNIKNSLISGKLLKEYKVSLDSAVDKDLKLVDINNNLFDEFL